MFKIFLVIVSMTVNFNQTTGNLQKNNENKKEITYIDTKSFHTYGDAINFIEGNVFLRKCEERNAKINYIELHEIIADKEKVLKIIKKSDWGE